MASTTETGHAKNIANQMNLNAIIAGFGLAYNPSNPLLKLTTMQAQYTDCNVKQGVVNEQNGSFKPLVNTRVLEFKPVPGLVRKVRNMAKSSGANDLWYKDVNTSVAKLLGDRAEKAVATPDDPAGTSSSQLSFDNMTNNFQLLVEVLSNEPMYAPAETDVNIVGLTAKHAAMNTVNNAVKLGRMPYNNAVIFRNKALYAKDTGLVDVCAAAKNYIRGVYGFKSAEFKLVSGLRFTQLATV